MKRRVFAGVEGGGTRSHVTLFSDRMEILASVKDGPSTNLFAIGNEETCKRIYEMLERCFKEVEDADPSSLASLGMSLSGCEWEETNAKLRRVMHEMYPTLEKTKIVVVSDTEGSLATASPNGGIVLISGTGSNCLLMNPDGTSGRCGGWGHMLGDGGSGFWIAQKACKIYFDYEDNNLHEDGLDVETVRIEKVKSAIHEYFNLKDQKELLVYCYTDFKKDHFAGLTKKLSEAAESGDELSRWIFVQAGIQLADHILAVEPKIHKDLLSASGGLPIVCIGSVWMSWKFLRPGFIDRLRSRAKAIKEVKLLSLKVPMTTGACYLGADKTGLKFHKSYKDNVDIFHHEKL